jgi:tripartite-type tricarboxylate transporter receptor subunit TctC
MRRILQRVAAALAAAGVLSGAAPSALAQDYANYPNKPVRIVVPYAAGGSTDILTRQISQKLTARLGQSVIVENRPGANGIIGTEVVAKSPADGYTLLMVTNGQTISMGMYPKLPWDLEKDLVPVANVAAMPNVIVVHPSQPFRTLKELIDALHARPGSLSYSHAGVGSPQHIAGELFKLVTRVNLVAVAYKGGGPAIADAVAGQVPVAVGGVPVVKQHIASGRLRALAVTSSARSPLLADVPTVSEFGYANFDAIFWIGLLAPRGTPEAAIARLNADTNAVLKDPEIMSNFAVQGATPAPGTPAEFGAYIRKDIETSGRVIREANIKPEG